MKKMTGKVLSTKLTNTVVVEIKNQKKHPIIGKRYQTTERILADSSGKNVLEGQKVALGQMRPVSKRKSWRVIGVEGENASA